VTHYSTVKLNWFGLTLERDWVKKRFKFPHPPQQPFLKTNLKKILLRDKIESTFYY